MADMPDAPMLVGVACFMLDERAAKQEIQADFGCPCRTFATYQSAVTAVVQGMSVNTKMVGAGPENNDCDFTTIEGMGM